MGRSRAKKTDRCIEGKVDCFAFGIYGKCKACVETDFANGCPFYKTKEQRREGHEAAVKRLEEKGLYGLIGKYGEQVDQARIWGEI